MAAAVVVVEDLLTISVTFGAFGRCGFVADLMNDELYDESTTHQRSDGV